MGKKKTKKAAKTRRLELPDAKAGSSIEYEHADKLLELMLDNNKLIRLFLETALGKGLVPSSAESIKSISLEVCERNQKFLSELIHLLRIVWYRIDVSDKQRDIFEEPEGEDETPPEEPKRPSKKKEAKLKGVLEGDVAQAGPAPSLLDDEFDDDLII